MYLLPFRAVMLRTSFSISIWLISCYCDMETTWESGISVALLADGIKYENTAIPARRIARYMKVFLFQSDFICNLIP